MTNTLILLAAALAAPPPAGPSGAQPPSPSQAGPRQKSRLMTVAHDGSDPRLVLEVGARIEAPNWTRDGKWLIYNGQGRLHRAPAGGGASTQIDTGPVTGINNDHGLTPDGKSIIFSARGHIYLVPTEGGEPRRVSSDEGEAAGLVHWWHGVTPDGKTLVFTGQRGEAKDLYTIPLLGGPLQALVPHPAEDDGPDYSPDGKWLYFNSERSGSNQIWRVAADGRGAPRQLTRDDRVNWFPHPSPDGKWLVYVSFPPGTKGHPRDKQVILRRMRPDGSGRVDVRALFGGQGTMNVPSWSPDSRRFAFVEYSAP